MTKNDNDKAHSVMSFYLKCYNAKFGRHQVINRNKYKFQIIDILKDLTVKELLNLVDYYINNSRSPSLQEFVYDYDSIKLEKDQRESDKENRIALLRQTKIEVQKFRERYNR